MLYYENTRSRASNIMSAHVHQMFYHERMRSYMHHIVSLPKYVLTYIVCLIVEVCARVLRMFSD